MAEGSLDDYKKVQTKEREVDTSKKMKVGIIGTGWIARDHVASYHKCPDVEIVALADLIPGKAEEFAKTYGVEGCRFYPSHKELLDTEELDAVSICTYSATHAECTVYALDKGVPVLVEKPMCVTLEEAIEMRRAEIRSGKICSVGFQPRFDENMKMVKQVVQSGALGEVYYVQTGGGRRRGIPTPYGTSFIEKSMSGIGALGDIGCYSLDVVMNAIGYPRPLTVTGWTCDYFGKNPKYMPCPEYAEKFNVDDFACGFIRLEGNIMLDFRIAWAMHMDTPGDSLIFGKDAGLRIPSTDCWNGSIGGPLKVYHDIAGKQVCTEIPQVRNEGNNFDKKIRSFIDAVKYGLPAPIPAKEIIYNQAILDGIARSAAVGHEVTIDIPADIL